MSLPEHPARGPFSVAEAYRNWYDLDDHEVLAELQAYQGQTGMKFHGAIPCNGCEIFL